MGEPSWNHRVVFSCQQYSHIYWESRSSGLKSLKVWCSPPPLLVTKQFCSFQSRLELIVMSKQTARTVPVPQAHQTVSTAGFMLPGWICSVLPPSNSPCSWLLQSSECWNTHSLLGLTPCMICLFRPRLFLPVYVFTYLCIYFCYFVYSIIHSFIHLNLLFHLFIYFQ